MAITLSINGNIQVTDNTTNAIAFTKALTAISTSGTIYTEAQTVNIGTSPTALTLPISPSNFVYIKNLHATNTLTVTWTPTGGASNPVVTLQAGASIVMVEPSGASGISALTVTASGANTNIEYILGG